MSYRSEASEEDDITLPEEGEEKINIGLYIGGRNIKSERDGKGWAILPNGDQYDGQYRQGKRHGIGLYVFQGGARYFGQYRCGHRSGRGIFIYPDGSYYEGCWSGNLKHGKGRYYYANGDTYCGDWYRGLRHGVGLYTTTKSPINPSCEPLRFRGTWRLGVRVGPFQFTFGNDENCTTLHGTWDNLYPQGPAVFSFNNCYLLMGYFQTPGREAWLSSQFKKKVLTDEEEYNEENVGEEHNAVQDIWADEPSLWYAQDICNYDFGLLPQEPVPLPISDSEVSVCSLSIAPTELTVEKEIIGVGEAEEEGGEMECIPCECECSTSGVESASEVACPQRGDPCAIEIKDQIS